MKKKKIKKQMNLHDYGFVSVKGNKNFTKMKHKKCDKKLCNKTKTKTKFHNRPNNTLTQMINDKL